MEIRYTGVHKVPVKIKPAWPVFPARHKQSQGKGHDGHWSKNMTDML